MAKFVNMENDKEIIDLDKLKQRKVGYKITPLKLNKKEIINMEFIDFLEEQIEKYKQEMENLQKEGYSEAEIEKIQRKIWHCEELIDIYIERI